MQVGEKRWMDVDKIYYIEPSPKDPIIFRAYVCDAPTAHFEWIGIEPRFFLPVFEALQNPLKKVDNAENTDKTDC